MKMDTTGNRYYVVGLRGNTYEVNSMGECHDSRTAAEKSLLNFDTDTFDAIFVLTQSELLGTYDVQNSYKLDGSYDWIPIQLKKDPSLFTWQDVLNYLVKAQKSGVDLSKQNVAVLHDFGEDGFSIDSIETVGETVDTDLYDAGSIVLRKHKGDE